MKIAVVAVLAALGLAILLRATLSGDARTVLAVIVCIGVLCLALFIPWRKKPEQYTKNETQLGAAAGALVGVGIMVVAVDMVFSAEVYCDRSARRVLEDICSVLRFAEGFVDLPLEAGGILLIGLAWCWLGAWIVFYVVRSMGSRHDR